ncbi:nuclear transport factor 2 family protein [Ekhidna sp. MALMAid0563]|uniref:YybH family protein n=1 Tax=Ekhidna sp. MALMAid0563 TaxID=3143937 RepID=UPI0032DF3963
MKTPIIICIALVAISSCSTVKKKDLVSLKQEIAAAEKAFNDYATEYGVKEAFLNFAHKSAVLNRRDSIIVGKEAIENYFDNQTLMEVTLQWKPDFIDVSSSGDMAYTYGKYTFSAITADSSEINASGIFHTVWKRDKNGEWKYVYD